MKKLKEFSKNMKDLITEETNLLKFYQGAKEDCWKFLELW